MSDVTIQERVDKATRPILNTIAKQDPIEAFVLAGQLIEASRNISSRGAGLRRAAIRSLRAEGWTLRELANEFGVTSARIAQIETGDN